MNNNRFNQKCVTQGCGTVVCNENGRKLELDCAGERFVKVKIDGCVEPKGGDNPRCDFMIIKEDENIEIYIELKGQDLKKAVKQIQQTIKMYGLSCANKYAAIVTTKIPKKDTSRDISIMSLVRITLNSPFVKNNYLKLLYNNSDNKISKIN